MSQPEILIYFSDQHDPRLIHGMGNALVRTPHLDRLMQQGTTFTSAYTSYPLCVPARMSFLTGQLPSRSGITSNQGTIPTDQVTFIHSLAVSGYHTALCGRMHFAGPDQRHGFVERFVGDMTPVLWHREGIDEERGASFKGTFAQGACTNIMGVGNSPVLEYDRQVVAKAVEHLSQDHEKPQCLVVGTYGPHFPYAAKPELYEYYLARVKLPETFGPSYVDPHPVHRKHFQPRDAETARKAMALYYAMVEEQDGHVGQVKAAFDTYCARRGKQGIFIYMSDHGDLNGEHNQYGKMMFLEGSARIPLIWAGSKIGVGVKIKSPVSIMDIGPTLCALTGAQLPPEQDGINLDAMLAGEEDPSRYALAELVDSDVEGVLRAGRMIRQGKWKLFCYEGLAEHDRLYDLAADPGEKNNLVAEQPARYQLLQALLREGWEPERIIQRHRTNAEHHRLLQKWWTEYHPQKDERWRSPAGLEQQFTRK